jgi:intracellular multiplication protein IcmC
MFKLNFKILVAVGIALFPLASYGLDYDFTDWLHNLQTHLPPVIQLIVASAYVMGLWFICLAILKLKAYGHQTVFMSTHASITGPLTYLVIGLVLFYCPTIVGTVNYTFWGYGTESIIAYPDSASTSLSGILDPVVAIVRVMGYIAFIRGWVILTRLGHQGGGGQGTIGKGIIHIVGGIMAINVVGTWYIIQNTLEYAF